MKNSLKLRPSEADIRGVRNEISGAAAPARQQTETDLHFADLEVQHRRIDQLVNELRLALKIAAEERTVRLALERIRDYLILHFDDEEQYMAKIGYPAERLALHIAAHIDLLDQTELISEFFGEPNLAAAISALETFFSHAQAHVADYDEAYLDFAYAGTLTRIPA